MENQSFTATLLVSQTPEEVFAAVTNPRAWWSEEIEGGTAKLNDEFYYHYRDVHRCTMKLVEVVPGEKVVWHVLDNYFSFTEDQAEWKDTRPTFEISREGDKTRLRFTHQGLVPSHECYEICHNAWTNYITSSMYNLITTGKGRPNTKEGNEFETTRPDRVSS